MATIKTILHLTPFYSPNIGGVETHLDDLVTTLDRYKYQNIVLTYCPLTTVTLWSKYESFGYTKIYRFNWFGYNLFHRLEKYPLLNFLYITPYLFIRSFGWLLFNKTKIDTIHSHGINAAFIGNILQKLFKIEKHVTSIYSTYDNVPLNSLSTKLLVNILNHTDKILTQSDQSITQLTKLGINKTKLSRYYHWIDLLRFSPVPIINHKSFSVLFVGRMIPQKNTLTLAKLASKFPQIQFDFIGTGPDYQSIQNLHQPNINLIGDVPYLKLHQYYQQSSVLCVPSIYAEGWGRVLAESVACGTPVIASNLGGTTEAVDSNVAILFSPTPANISKAITKIYNDKTFYHKLKNNCRPYALKHYSDQNIKFITKHY